MKHSAFSERIAKMQPFAFAGAGARTGHRDHVHLAHE